MTHHHRSGSAARMKWALALLAGWMIIEVLGGWWSGSLALLSDAGHMASDVAALSLAVLASRIARRSPTPRQTYGFHRAEVLAALVNASALLVIATSVVWEALRRLHAPSEVLGVPMLVVAAGGLLVNLAALWLLHAADRTSLNVRAASWHLVGDLLGSIGALASGIAVTGWGLRWTDPAASIGIALLITLSSLRLLREVLDILMEGVPRHLDPGRLRDAVLSTRGVRSIHDLHVWTLSSGREVLTCHVVLDGSLPPEDVQRAIRQTALPFGLSHLTIQTEQEDCGEDCGGTSRDD